MDWRGGWVRREKKKRRRRGIFFSKAAKSSQNHVDLLYIKTASILTTLK
jgi:hypothetical protein